MQFKASNQSPLEKTKGEKETKTTSKKRKASTEDSFKVVIWQDTSILTFRELQEEIPSKSESPQQAIHRTWRWDNVVPRSLIKETIQALLEWMKELKTCFLFPQTRPLILPSNLTLFPRNVIKNVHLESWRIK